MLLFGSPHPDRYVRAISYVYKVWAGLLFIAAFAALGAWYVHAVREPDADEHYRNLVEAVRDARNKVKANSSDAQAQYDLGCALANILKWDQSAQAYREAIRLRPDYTDAYSHLGNVDINRNQIGKAIEAYKAAVRLDPQNSSYLCTLGDCYLKIASPRAAIPVFMQAVKITPDCASCYVQLGIAYNDIGNKVAACEAWEKALACEDPSSSWHESARYYLNKAKH